MVWFPACKINLGLRVLQRRDDGYHDIETCFYPLPWNDILEIIPSNTMSFTNTGISIPGQVDENLCLKAFYLLQEKFALPSVEMHLHKIIPMGAGLGGGSSDAACTLTLLNKIFELDLSTDQLVKYAAKLGSDCAFFIHNKPMIGTSRGEVLTPIDMSLKGKYMVVIKPDVHVSTKEAYAGIVPSNRETGLADALIQLDISNWKNEIVNDFEHSVFEKYPIIRKIKEDLYTHGAAYASMSGSGSAVFGIFNSEVGLERKFEGMIYWSGTL